MDEFCGSEFWNSSSFLSSSEPDFTPCFEKTVLVWVPCVYFWLFSMMEARILQKSKDRWIPWSIFSISKVVGSCAIIVILMIDLVYNIVKSTSDDVFAVDFYSPIFLIVTIAMQLLVVLIEKRRGIQSSGYLFVFWFLLLVCGIAPLRTFILNFIKSDQEVSLKFVTYVLYFICVSAVFFVNFFADKRPKKLHHFRAKDCCPELEASFPSRLTFSWMNGLIWRGYKSPITQDMLWDLSHENSSACVTKSWDKYWDRAVLNSYNKGKSHTTATYLNNSSRIYMVGVAGNKDHYVSILPTMLKCFGVEFLLGSLLKLVHDVLQFVSPYLMNLLIDFTVDFSKPGWLGYVYAVGFLVTTQLQSLFLGQYFARMFIIGLKIRTAIISAVYRKALKISNSARKDSTVGEVVNLMSVDAQRFMDLTTYLNMIWSAPLQIILCLYFLWQILGPSVLAGLAVMVILIPINGFLANKQKLLQIRQMKLKDQRVKLINEILNGIKVLKLYAWEPSFEDQVLAVRKQEISVLKRAAYLNTVTSFLWTCTPFIVSLATFAVYVIVSSFPLDARTAFVSITLFNLLRFPLSMLPMMISSVIQAGVSLKRMNKFLNSDELDANAVSKDSSAADAVIIENGTFAWGKSREDQDILTKIDLRVREGSLIAVVGPVGCGKSSLCSAMLGEMEKVSGKVNLKGSIAYVPQQAWIQNATLEENILFGKAKERCFYQETVDACALKTDFDMLPAKDQTEIGEKGINLSGGQKQRVSLARAVYADADVYLLDDPLSAVDSHVGRHIFDHVISSQGLLGTKTRVLVTHNLSYLPRMDYIVVMRKGRITEQGTYTELMAKKGELQEFLLQYIAEEETNNEGFDDVEEIKHQLEMNMGKEVLKRRMSRISRESESSSTDGKTRNGDLSNVGSLRRRHQKKCDEEKEPITSKGHKAGEKLIQAEKAETGRVSFAVYRYYLQAIGYLTMLLTVLFYAASQGFSVGSNVWLSKWSEDNTTSDHAVRDMYLGVYGALGFFQAIFVLFGALSLLLSTLIAAESLHWNVLSNVLRIHLQFFDTNPIGRVLNRFSKDIDTMDNVLPMNLRGWFMCIGQVVATLTIITYATPIFVAVLLPVMVLYYFIQVIYVRSSRQLKRIESITRSPIYSHFGESIQGAATIRAYGKTYDFILESNRKVDYNQVSYYPSIIANRWLAIRLELLGNIITFCSALFAVMSRESITGGDVGLSVSYALSVTQTLNWLVRMTSDVETNIVAVERIKEYTETEQEAAWEIEQKRPPSDWPHKGSVRFENYSTRYRRELDLVIKGIDCEIEPMEKVGIVGRTGAGKSSLTLALFRVIEPAGGRIVIDGVDISQIGLHDLRRNLTIIPQDPVLFSGTLRMNLDPFDTYSDRAIWDALEHAHLKDYVSSLGSKLQYEVSEGGENLSVGQRQLVCLARALLRKTKILVLDEATAAVDLETDTLIQETIRREFSDCTVITIAHRLNTILDSNRVLVMDKGSVKEFDSPSKLLTNTNSMFYSMAKDAGLI